MTNIATTEEAKTKLETLRAKMDGTLKDLDAEDCERILYYMFGYCASEHSPKQVAEHFLQGFESYLEFLPVVEVGDYIEIPETNWKHYRVCDAPNGGRTDQAGAVHKNPFAFIIAVPHVISDPPQAQPIRKTIRIGRKFYIKGYGAHKVCEPQPINGDSVKTRRLYDGFTA